MKKTIANLMWWALTKISPEDFLEDETTEEIEEVKSSETLALEACGGNHSWLIPETVPEHLLTDTTDTKIIGGSARELMFKVTLWSDFTSKSLNDFGVFYRSVINQTTWEYDIKMFIVMSSDDAMHYREWQAKYDKQFPTTGKKLLPVLPDCYTINGTAIHHAGMKFNHSLQTYEPNRDCLAQWKWIISNCEGTVYVTEQTFIFEKDTDAVHYRLHPIRTTDNKKR